MEGTENPGGSAVETTTESVQPAAQPTAGESGGAEQEQRPSINERLRAYAGHPTSSPAEGSGDGQSAPEGDETPSTLARGADGRFLPRRAVPKIVNDAEDRIKDLERQVAERDPEKIRATILAEQAQRAAGPSDAEQAALFEQSCRMADTDQRLSELVEGDPQGRTLYQWREDRKDLVARYPEAEAAIRGDAQAWAEQQIEGFKAPMRAEMDALAAEVGIDTARWKARGTTWGSMARDAIEAVAAPLHDRIRELETELGRHARFNGGDGLGATRTLVGAGRSGNGAAPLSTNERINNALRDVLNGRRAAG